MTTSRQHCGRRASWCASTSFAAPGGSRTRTRGAAVECFVACARERAQTPPDDPEHLADDGGDLLFYDAYWEDGELVVSLCRQFALVEDDEDQAYLDRLNLELRTTAGPAQTPESSRIGGAGGSDVTVDEWARRVRSDPTFAAMVAVPVGVVRFDQGPAF